MRTAGELVAAGPFSDQPDETFHGLCVYACDVEARALAESDPSVQVGRMAIDEKTWSTVAGSVRDGST